MRSKIRDLGRPSQRRRKMRSKIREHCRQRSLILDFVISSSSQRHKMPPKNHTRLPSSSGSSSEEDKSSNPRRRLLSLFQVIKIDPAQRPKRGQGAKHYWSTARHENSRVIHEQELLEIHVMPFRSNIHYGPKEEQRTCIWAGGEFTWTEKSSGIPWIGVNGTVTTCVVAMNGKTSLRPSVAFRRVHEGGTTIHGVPLSGDLVKVVVEDVLDADAPVPVPTLEVRLVGEAAIGFIAWPRHLVKAISTKDIERQQKRERVEKSVPIDNPIVELLNVHPFWLRLCRFSPYRSSYCSRAVQPHRQQSRFLSLFASVLLGSMVRILSCKAICCLALAIFLPLSVAALSLFSTSACFLEAEGI